ncbi:MAG: hypothetical protein R3246_13675 [Acidimicrobiia bacterium]|nr:hypothetical protein [Acidimicrobiia bacterium]
MTGLELAIAVSAREWPDRLRRFLADHGGARVRVSAMGPEDLLGESFDVLLIDDICSFLTPRLVDVISDGGRRVVGIYDPEEFADGKERLLECGVADVIESYASPEEIVAVAARVFGEVRRDQSEPVFQPEAEHREAGGAPVQDDTDGPAPARVIAIGGPPGGSGATEVAIALADELAGRGQVVLVDCDDNAPSLAQRLGLPLHPNIRTAVDVLEHRSGTLDRVLHSVERMMVLPGLANVGDWAEVRPRQVADLLRMLAVPRRHVVVNIGSRLDASGFGEGMERSAMSRTVVGLADMVVGVGLASPMGVARLLDWASLAHPLASSGALHLMINRTPSARFKRGELLQEVTRTYQPASFVFLPEDSRVGAGAWNGQLVTRGRFRKAVGSWAAGFVRSEMSA